MYEELNSQIFMKSRKLTAGLVMKIKFTKRKQLK